MVVDGIIVEGSADIIQTVEEKMGEKYYMVIWHNPKRLKEVPIAQVTTFPKSNLDNILGWLFRENYIIEYIFDVDNDVKNVLVKGDKL